MTTAHPVRYFQHQDETSHPIFPTAPLDRLWAKSGKWLVLRGVISLTFGALILLLPFKAPTGFVMAFAAYAATDAALSIAGGLKGERTIDGRSSALVLRGAVGLCIAIALAGMPLLGATGSTLAILLLLAVWALLTGMLEMAAAIQVGRRIEGEWLLAGSGLLALMLGAALPVLTSSVPGGTLLSFAWMIGAYALAAGILLLAHGFGVIRGNTG